MLSSKTSIWSIITVAFVAIVVALVFSQPTTATTVDLPIVSPSSPTTNTQYWTLAWTDGSGGNMFHFWWFRRTFTPTYGANLITVIPKGITVWGCDGQSDCTVTNYFFENTTPGTEGLAIHGQALMTGTYIIRTIVEEPYEEPFEISSTLTVRQLPPAISSITPNSVKAGDTISITGDGFTSPFVPDLRSITVWIRNISDNSFEFYDLIEVLEKGGTWEESLVRLPLRKNLKPGQYLVTITVGGLSSNSLVCSVLTTVFLPSISSE